MTDCHYLAFRFDDQNLWTLIFDNLNSTTRGKGGFREGDWVSEYNCCESSDVGKP